MKAALLAVVPAAGGGIPFQDLADAVQPHLPAELFANASVSWYGRHGQARSGGARF